MGPLWGLLWGLLYTAYPANATTRSWRGTPSECRSGWRYAVGSVRETVTKVVGELTREGLIAAGYGKIALLDVAKLGAVAGK